MARVKAISARGFNLSHDAVYKLSSSRRKVRMVFHRSEKSSTKHHLRCVPLIPHVRIRVGRRYRKNTSMRLVIHLEDHCYQHILRRDDEDPLLTYELSTVGLTPAPYLVTKCMLQPAEDEHRNFPIAASIVTMGPIHRRSVNWRRYIQEGTNAWSGHRSVPWKRAWYSAVGFERVSTPHWSDRRSDQVENTGRLDNGEDAWKFLGCRRAVVHCENGETVDMSYIAKIFDPLGLLGHHNREDNRVVSGISRSIGTSHCHSGVSRMYIQEPTIIFETFRKLFLVNAAINCRHLN